MKHLCLTLQYGMANDVKAQDIDVASMEPMVAASGFLKSPNLGANYLY